MVFIYSALTFLGWALLASASFVWGGHFIYELFQGVGFWESLGGNFIGWVVQLIVGAIALRGGYILLQVKPK